VKEPIPAVAPVINADGRLLDRSTVIDQGFRWRSRIWV
jgi:hypothetical protein